MSSRLPTRSLLARANRLLALVGAVAVAVSGGAAWLAWQYALDAYAARVAEQTVQHYKSKVAEDRRAWNRAAQRLRAQIEFLRIGELPAAQRHARLVAFFNAQGENRDFSGVLLATPGGMPLFSLGCHAMLQESLDVMQMLSLKMEDVFMRGHCSDSHAVYSVTHTSLWLGSEGRGMALYATALDHAYLGRLARGMDLLYLHHDGRLMATSRGAAHLSDRIDTSPRRHPREGDLMQVVLPVGEQMDGPVLIVRRSLDPFLSTQAILLGVGLTTLILLVLIWFGLGRAIRSHLKTLNSLSLGADAFQHTFQRDPELNRQLEQVASHPDEMGRLGQALDSLMNEAENRYLEQAGHLQTLDMLEEVVVELDLNGRLQRVSSAWHKVSGIDATVTGQVLADYFDPEDAPALTALIAALARQEKQQATARLRLSRRGEGERWLELRLVRVAGGDTLRGVMRDITQSYLQERRITHMALHDALTGLPNRVLLEDRLKVAIRQVERSGHKVALGFIDLDHFKNVNDSLGHKTGDQLLIALAQRLRQYLRQGDTLARWGGDEFVLLLQDMPSVDAVREVAEKLRQATESPLKVEDNEFNLTFSAGFAIYPDDADDGDLLLAHADRAMFYAKAQGRNNLQLFCDMSQKGLGKKEIYIQQRLAAAIREKRIDNHYQPLLDARTGHIAGIETLARWFEPDLGWISPATFIPMAENLGLIRELGEQVWHRALRDMEAWKAHGFGLSVNLSKRQLFMPYFTEKLLEDAEAHGLEPGRITLEITESMALLDVEYSAERLRQLRAAGFRLSIDDFGTGYSSLSQLHELPVHELKIDIAFVRRIQQPQGARLIQAIIGMAINLDLETVAEGVEDAEVAKRLTDMGVNVLQGWHCGRPMPAEAFTAWLRDH
ncbi:MAG: EAL domain-containing protein [Pseudomonadota bacterium]|nr:EAL domain-containing protein [Pseudomonadota bacterium]